MSLRVMQRPGCGGIDVFERGLLALFKERQTMLVLVLRFPISLAAQEGNPSAVKSQSARSAAAQANLSTAGDQAAPAQTDSSNDLASDPDTNAPQQPIDVPSQSTPPPPPRESKPKIPRSATSTTQLPRIRFASASTPPSKISFPIAPSSSMPNAVAIARYRLYFRRRSIPGPGVPNSINFQQLFMNVEYSPHRRFSGFAEVPIRWLQTRGFQPIPPFPTPPYGAFSNQAGVSDVTAGFKFAAAASESAYLTFQFKSYFPSGDASKGTLPVPAGL
jgi:hypothetical protein